MRRFTVFASLVSLFPLIFSTAAHAQYQAPAGYEIVPLVDGSGNPLTPGGLAVNSSGEMAVTNGETVTLYNTWQNGRTVIGTVTDSAWEYDTDPVFLNSTTILFGESGNTSSLWSVNFATPTPTVTQITTPSGQLPNVEGAAVLNSSTAIVSGDTSNTDGDLYLKQVNLNTGGVTSIVSNIGNSSGYPGNPAVTPGGNLALLEDVLGGTSYAHIYDSSGDDLDDISLALQNGDGFGAYGIAFDSTGNGYVTTGNTITEIQDVDSNSPVVSEFGSADENYEQYLTSISFTGGAFNPGEAGDTGALIVNDAGEEPAGDGYPGGAFAIVVPEPSSIGLLAGAILLAARRRPETRPEK